MCTRPVKNGARQKMADSGLTIRSRPMGPARGAYSEVSDLLYHPLFLETHLQLHHSVRKSEHLMRSARYAYFLAGVFRANKRVCARAGLLHDLYSRFGTWSNHGAIAASVARDMGENREVCNTIVPHMFPMGPMPRTREGWVLALADKMATVVDTAHFVAKMVNGESLRQRRMLRASDQFLPRNRGESRLRVAASMRN